MAERYCAIINNSKVKDGNRFHWRHIGPDMHKHEQDIQDDSFYSSYVKEVFCRDHESSQDLPEGQVRE